MTPDSQKPGNSSGRVHKAANKRPTGNSRRAGKRLAPHVPPNYPSTFDWFLSGLKRQPAGTVLALLSSYSALWIALWYAVFGMLLGMLVAFKAIHSNSVTEFLFHAGAGTSVTAVGVATGALAGAGGSFVTFYTNSIFISPLQLFVGVLVGLLVGVLFVAVTAVFEGQFLKLRGCRRPVTVEVLKISPILQQLGLDYNFRNAPRFAVREDLRPKAWAAMRYIILTTGLLEDLETAELTAVIAHELHHWRMGDSVGEHFVWACAWPVALLYNVAARASRSTSSDEKTRRPLGFLGLITWIIAWPAWILLKFPISLAVRHNMRLHEFEADAAAKKIGYGPQLIAAIRQITALEQGSTGWQQTLYATHPSPAERIDRLARTPEDADYIEPDLGSESKAILTTLGAVALIFAIFIAWGAVLNSHRSANAATTPTTSAPRSPNGLSAPATPRVDAAPQQQRTIEHIAASYTGAMIDNIFNTQGLDNVITQYAAPEDQQSLESQSNAYITGLYGQSPSAFGSSAQPVACIVNFATLAQASVGVFFKWTFTSEDAPTVQWVSTNIPLSFSGDRWTVTGIPNVPGYPGVFGETASDVSPVVPAGYGSCS